ncbi:MAG: cytoplasmic protein [Bacteroidetes bacterium HGW-Bacteroidetes-21]|jgi:predicted nuclease of restriction endonuclease-like (RecB) superfamily|nr:MAG: cytoplasmic protein [Bacteroidetes bacterium HGW-Bacteroidetes-21]
MNFDILLKNLQNAHVALHASAAKSVNITMTIRNWLFGFYIVEYEQKGEDRAKYGEKLLLTIEKELKHSGLKGLSATNLKIFRQFYAIYPEIGQTASDFLVQNSLIGQTASDKLKTIDIKDINAITKVAGKIKRIGLEPVKIIQSLSFSHIVELIKIDDPLKRAFYEMECVKGVWSVRELQRQIGSLYFERSGLSKDKNKLSELVSNKAVKLKPADVFNDPVAIEFLGLSDRALVAETDLEQAILDHLQMFLLEMGNGFCFEARQKRILIDDTYDFIDLVFYNRILKCHVLVDLKVEKFKHDFAGQMNAYLNYYKHEVMTDDDNPPVGILLCTDKGNTMVKYATAGLEKSIFVHKYMVNLPSKEELENYIKNEIV